MIVNEAIKKIMKDTNTRQQTLADNVGFTRATDVGRKLCIDNMTTNTVIRLVNAMGYELVIQKRTSGKRPDGQIVLERSDLNKD